VVLIEIEVEVEVVLVVCDEVLVEVDEEVEVVEEVELVSWGRKAELVVVEVVVMPLANWNMTVVDGFPVKDVHATETVYAIE